MTLSYNVGLTGGSLVAYVLDAMLGPPLVAPCRAPPRYFTPNPRTMLANLTTPYTTVAATTAVTVATVLTTSPTTLTSLANPTTLSNLTLALYNVTTMH